MSIEAGVGVDLTKMEKCLTRMCEYRVSSTASASAGAGSGGPFSAGKLRSLSGMRVKIGRYLGVSDDGCCIIPWDWEL
jgi:Domain of unknown function (DUF4461)